MAYITTSQLPSIPVSRRSVLFGVLGGVVATVATSQPSAAGKAIPAPPPSFGDLTGPTLRYGNRGRGVKRLQRYLIRKGYRVGPGGADSHFGLHTKAAVRALQRDQRITIDGVAGPQTWRTIGHMPDVKRPSVKNEPSARYVIRQGSRGQHARRAQQLLVERGVWIGRSGADGDFGPNSVRGLKDFQRLYHLEQDGVLGPETWRALVEAEDDLSHLPSHVFNPGEYFVTDKSDRRSYFLRDGQLIKLMPSRVGGHFQFRGKWKKGHTPNGKFGVIWEKQDDSSAIFDNTPMYYSLYFTDRGHAVHGSDSFTRDGNYRNAKGRAGSGGCINLTIEHSRWLWTHANRRKLIIIVCG